MGTRVKTERRKVPGRTVVAAIAMLAGIVLMGLGYFQNERVMLSAGAAITLSGVMTEAFFRVIRGARERRGGRIAGV